MTQGKLPVSRPDWIPEFVEVDRLLLDVNSMDQTTDVDNKTSQKRSLRAFF
jgi:hypothetical protein